jgi:YbbR domain-containing protein
MLYRLRENFALKVIALTVSLLLWFYVAQTERPAQAKGFVAARVVTENVPPTVDTRNIPPQIMVSVIGTQAALAQLKDSDVQAVLDLHELNAAHDGPVYVRPMILLPEHTRGVSCETPPAIRVPLNHQEQLSLVVQPLFSNEPPIGFRYGPPVIRPRTITLTGLAERLAQVDRVVANAAPEVAGGNIDGDFPVQAWDNQNAPVEGLRLHPEKVHVTVRLLQHPATKIVPVSPSIVDQPPPPYLLGAIVVTPNQVRITGRPEHVDRIETVATEDISVRSLALPEKPQKLDAQLVLSPDVSTSTLLGKPIDHVTVTISLRKIPAPGPAVAPAPARP